MNSQFLEFLGNYLIQAAKWQNLMAQTPAGTHPAVMDGTELSRLFNQFCNFNGPHPPEFGEYSRIWQQTIENFQSIFVPYAKMWGWVPEADHRNLQKKCEALEKKIRKQDQTISQFRSLLDEKGLGQIEMLQRFQSLIQDQSDEFQTFMQNFGEAFTKDAS